MEREHVIPIPGPRYLGNTAFGVFFTLFWYALVATQLPSIITGRDGMFDTGQRGLDVLLWLAFMLLPLYVIRFFAWNAIGWEYVRVTGGYLIIERKALGIPLFRRETYDVAKIAHLHQEGPPPGNLESWVLRRPSEVGALVFDYEGNTIRFGYVLLEQREVAGDVLRALRKWMHIETGTRMPNPGIEQTGRALQ
ncbi:MAG: hypothetical protein Q7V14_05500 [Coriobacteriia bacterium]|nr:hypothetical protein [Coriobacteriia bacterium]